MALPKIDLPVFETVLPSTKKNIKYRPFTVKEEKILLVAQEANEPGQELLAIKQIVNNCVMDIDVEELPMFDVEYILLQLRAKSVNNTIEFQVKDPDTEEDVSLTIDLDQMKLEVKEEHSNKIPINDEYSLFLKYPSINEFIQIFEMNPDDPLADYFVMVSCLDYIASDDEIHRFKDYGQKDIDAFMESMQGDVIKKIQTFFETMPRLRHETKYTNKEGKEQTFVIEGMRSFFL